MLDKRKILLIGSSGQIGSSVESLIKGSHELVILNRPTFDFTRKEELKNLILKINPCIIVNAAAYTSVDLAEQETHLALTCNQEAPKLLAQISSSINALLIHFSTDYVFDGNKTDTYFEEDLCNPINMYGYSKRLGEVEIINSGCKHFIFRTSWVYGPFRKNFLKTILNLAVVKKSIGVVDDQTGLPTSTNLVSMIVEKFINLYIGEDIADKDYGIYHLAALGKVSWHGFACSIIKGASKEGFEINIEENNVLPISSSEYPFVAKRPMHSVLNVSKLTNFLGVEIFDWEIYLTKVLQQIRTGSI